MQLKLGVSGLFFSIFMILAPPTYGAEGFYGPKDFKQIPIAENILKVAYDAVVSTSDSGHCSGIPISNSQTLTALHCEEGKVPFTQIAFPDQSGAIFLLNATSSSQVFVSGGSFPKFFESMIEPATWTQPLRDSYANAYTSDWAIANMTNPTKTVACVNLKSISFDEWVFGVGYPTFAYRSKFSSNGINKYLSYGKKISDLNLNSYFHGLPRDVRQLHENLIQPLIDSEDLLLLDIDGRPGNSGGPVFDSNGNLVGVLVAGLIAPGSGNQFEFQPNIGIAISMKTIFRALTDMGKNPKDIFPCVIE